jgi:hypothetical protein
MLLLSHDQFQQYLLLVFLNIFVVYFVKLLLFCSFVTKYKKAVYIVTKYYKKAVYIVKGSHGHNHMIVGFTATYAISAYHH